MSADLAATLAPARADAPPYHISALVSARLCHDLVSPLGAIGNGLELIEMAGTNRSEAEIALIADSLENALGKLKFLRVAFGPADPDARQSFDEAATITASAFQGRFSIAWAKPTGDLPRPFAKALYLAILCLERSLPLGGEVRIDTDGARATLKVEGRRTAPPTELWAHVTAGAPLGHLSADMVQFALLRETLSVSGGRIDTAFAETGATIQISVPRPG